MEFLKELNEAQRVAACHVEGPMMVIAGAGSGKTRVLTYRIAHLISKGVDAFSILALTFTNKAAREMKERIAQVIGDGEARNIWMGTFHSIFARILRIECERINYPRNFTIYDTADSRALIKDIIKGLGLDDKVYKPASVQGRISNAKNNLIDAAGYADHPEIMSEDAQAGRPRIAEIYKAYENRCFRAQAMDFDDLLFKMNVLLRDFPDLLLKYQHTFQFILVDEYQDTNFAQYLIIKQLAAMRENLCVVGDDAQSIYGFRGANIQNIFNFKKDYPDFNLFKLEQNYRSTRFIVDAANSVIAKNTEQIEKVVWTHNEEGQKIKVHRCYSDHEEGKLIASGIFDTHNQQQSHWQNFAILYRTNAQSRSFEESLRKLNIPYRIYGGLSFYQRKEIKDLIAYFRLTANHRDDEALKRVINYPARGIGKTTMDRLLVESTERELAIWDLVENVLEPPASIQGAALRKVKDFIAMVKGFAAELNTKDAHDLGMHIAKHTGLVHTLYQDKTPEGVARYDNLQELLNGMKSFVEQARRDEPDAIPTLGDFLMDVALLTDADQDDGDNNKVSLMSIHAAKGLEFTHVQIVGLEENLFPSQMAMQSRADLEEERRLFYVALTRAKKSCSLSYALTRYKWGQLIQAEPSRFLDEINPDCVIMPSAQSAKPTPFSGGDGFEPSRNAWQSMASSNSSPQTAFERLSNKGQPTTTSSPFKGTKSSPTPKSVEGKPLTRLDDAASPSATPQANREEAMQEGTNVMHERFGKGKVIRIEGEAPNQKATVFFPSSGQKQLLLKFAKLQVIT
ncbi:MAG: UvrD-helicase domain-containing protein [Flavobacteriales bacterium]|nr:UvrD-helicase domain-containing protein [Flavobacteriales bacterium]